MLTFVIKEGRLKGAEFEVLDGLTIGRDPANTIQIPIGLVSRFHARIENRHGNLFLVDLGSRNGTTVNGNHIKEYHLAVGDTIQIGDTLMSCIQNEDVALSSTRKMKAQDWDAPKIAAKTDESKLELLKKETHIGDVKAFQQAHSNLVTLYELNKLASETVAHEELFSMLVDKLQKALQADRIFPVTIEKASDTWSPWSRPKNAVEKKLYAVPPSSSVIELVMSSGEAVLCASAEEDRRFKNAPSIQANKVSTIICAPLHAGKQLLGLLYADRLGESNNFTHEDLEFLTAAGAQIATSLSNLNSSQNLQEENSRLRQQLYREFVAIGKCDALKQVGEFITRAARIDSPALIMGESGTGKELVARALHAQSPRSHKPFEAVNCAALTESLIESELFGHVKGAFTGAHQDRLGRFELANGGVIFLDEIGELPEASQAKLLRALETGEIRRVGGEKDIKVNVRLIAATNKDLDVLTREGKFRQDLFYRLNVLRVVLPPLRERGDDIRILIDHYLRHYAEKCGRENIKIIPEAMDILLKYPWPGNIRELKNIIERMVVMSRDELISSNDVPFEIRMAPKPGTVSGAVPLISLAEVEKQHVLNVLNYTGGNRKEAADILQIDRSTLYAKLKTYGAEDTKRHEGQES